MAQTPDFPPNLYHDLLEAIADGVYFTDRERRIAYWNRGAEALTGYGRAEVVGRRCMDNLLVHIDDAGTRLCLGHCPLAATLEDGEPREADVYLHHREGHRVPVRVRVFPIRDAGGAVTGAVEVFNDNTAARRAAEHLERMERLALLDHLTGIANRRRAESALRSRLEELRRNGWGFGVLMMDIDDFKAVNDTYGHETGDRVLRLVGRTLEAGARSFDLVGRWGGEEFVAVVAGADRGALHEAGERLRMLVAHSSLDGDLPLAVTLSVGCAEARPGDTPESLVARADRMLYEAKRSGKNQVCSLENRGLPPGGPENGDPYP